MFNFPAILIANGTAILLLFVIILSPKKPLRHGLFNEKIFYAMVILNMLQCIMESAGFFIDGKAASGYRTLSVALDTTLFINSSIFAYLWIIYADYKLFTDMNRIKRIYPFMALPAILIIIGCLINLATPVFFMVDEYNIYHRADLFFVPYIATYFYVAYGVVLIYAYRKKVNKYLFLPAMFFITPIILGSLLQFFFYGYSLMWLGVSVGMISLFVSFQNESSYVDALSGLYNRQYLENLLLLYNKKENPAGIPAAIMLDIDDFKSINDRFGHFIGDDAIAKTGKILYNSVGDKGLSCRYGGDEFIILMHIHSEKEIMDMIDAIKTQVTLFNESANKPYQLHFSIGYSTYNRKHESMDDFLKKIDDSMYEDKKRKIEEKKFPDRRQNR